MRKTTAKGVLIDTLVTEPHDVRMRQVTNHWRQDPNVTVRTFTRAVKADGEAIYVTALIVRRKTPRQVSCGCCTGGCVCQIHSRDGLMVTCAYHQRAGHTRETETQATADARRDRDEN